MDVFNALQTSVAGLRAQANALNNISGNIANSQTTGYKRIDTSFVDLLAEQTPKHEVAGSVAAFSQLTNTVQGGLNATGIPTNMAINGDGFFVVQRKTSEASGAPTFSGADLYTRRGDFTADAEGYLVNGAGSYLIGSTLDPITGQSTSSGPIQISNSILPAKTTTAITYSANLPKAPSTAASATSGSAIYNAAIAGPGVIVTSGTGTGTVTGTDAQRQTFIDNSIAGPALTVFSPAGAAVGLQTRWAKVQEAASGNSGDVWNLFYAKDSTVTGSKSDWVNVGTAFTFDGSGKLTSPTNGSVALSNLNVNGADIGTVQLNLTGGLTQYGSSTGGVTTNTLQQNGYASGTLTGVDVTEDGRVSGTYSNGATIALAKIGIVQFNNPNGLKPDSLGNYTQTLGSGVPIAGLKNATILGGNVEQSNTDIASEFSKMIVTQQAYSANTRVMSTTQSMISDLLNVIR